MADPIYVTIEGTLLDPYSSDPITDGQVRITPTGGAWWPGWWDQTYPAGSPEAIESAFSIHGFSGSLDSSGDFSIEVVALDDPNLDLNGMTAYEVTVEVPGYVFDPVSITPEEADDPLDISASLAATPITGNIGQAPHAMVNGGYACWPGGHYGSTDGVEYWTALHAWAMPVPTPFSFTEVSINVVSGNSGDKARIGAFTVDPNEGRLRTLYDFGLVGLDTSGVKTISGGPWTFSAGVVWMGLVLEDSFTATIAAHPYRAPAHSIGPIHISRSQNYPWGGSINTSERDYTDTGAFAESYTIDNPYFLDPTPMFSFGRIILEA